VHGFIARKPVYKAHPKDGKTPGWWLFLVLDPEPGIKRWTVELRANGVCAEPTPSGTRQCEQTTSHRAHVYTYEREPSLQCNGVPKS
jgi:hypothetical protein